MSPDFGIGVPFDIREFIRIGSPGVIKFAFGIDDEMEIAVAVAGRIQEQFDHGILPQFGVVPAGTQRDHFLQAVFPAVRPEIQILAVPQNPEGSPDLG